MSCQLLVAFWAVSRKVTVDRGLKSWEELHWELFAKDYDSEHVVENFSNPCAIHLFRAPVPSGAMAF